MAQAPSYIFLSFWSAMRCLYLLNAPYRDCPSSCGLKIGVGGVAFEGAGAGECTALPEKDNWNAPDWKKPPPDDQSKISFLAVAQTYWETFITLEHT